MCISFPALTELNPYNLGDYGNESFLPRSRGSGPQKIRVGLSLKQKCARTLDDWDRVRYERTWKGDVLIYENHRFSRRGTYGDTVFWSCNNRRPHCAAYMITNQKKPTYVAISGVHNHA
ncbi:hypothetical protein KR093_001658 [Drosophila rubida]|uniref:FLYWCH-type domain-containing protein n=1 Tax=Drosophila rubida TaxID=30044 RepID=A0AAD4PH65_9MUSC|nr:hypothetical protein KR093_001658 [Drosophila rubida]